MHSKEFLDQIFKKTMMDLRAFKKALLRRKHIDGDGRSTSLKRCLTTFDLTALGRLKNLKLFYFCFIFFKK